MADRAEGKAEGKADGKPAGLLRSVSVVSLMTAISRVGGLVREVAMAYYFGTSALKSAFDIAFMIPNLFRRLFGEGALSSAFVPIFSKTLESEGREAANRFAMRLVTILIVFLGAVTLVGVLLSYPIERFLAVDSHWRLPMPMLRIMLPYAMLICVAALISGMLNTLGRFGIAALTPFLLNLIWILTLVGIFPFLRSDPSWRIVVLSWMILLAGLLQIVFQLPALHRRGIKFRFIVQGIWGDEKIKRVLQLMGPAVLGMGLVQINVCVDKLLAYFADTASPAALEYAERIVYLPLGMFATAFVTVLLPTFSWQAARGEYGAMSGTLERALRNLAVIMAPCSAGLLVLALPCIEMIYSIKGGQFSVGAESGGGISSAVLSARALAAYAPGLLVFSYQKAMTPLFYGLQDMRTPVKISLYGLVLNITMNVSSVLFLPAGWKHVGIAGSTVVTSAVNTVMLGVALRKRKVSVRFSGFLPVLFRVVVAAVVMSGVAYYLHGALLVWVARLGLAQKLVQIGAMVVTVVVAAGVYVGVVQVLAPQALREMWGELRERKRKRGGRGNGE